MPSPEGPVSNPRRTPVIEEGLNIKGYGLVFRYAVRFLHESAGSARTSW